MRYLNVTAIASLEMGSYQLEVVVNAFWNEVDKKDLQMWSRIIWIQRSVFLHCLVVVFSEGLQPLTFWAHKKMLMVPLLHHYSQNQKKCSENYLVEELKNDERTAQYSRLKSKW